MSELADFLLARIAEDEAVAVATRDAHDPLIWNASDYGDTGAWGMGGPVDGPSGYESIVVAPARVLAECEAKRALITVLSDVEWTGSYAVRDVALGIMSTPYADHPDFRDEWRP